MELITSFAAPMPSGVAVDVAGGAAPIAFFPFSGGCSWKQRLAFQSLVPLLIISKFTIGWHEEIIPWILELLSMVAVAAVVPRRSAGCRQWIMIREEQR